MNHHDDIRKLLAAYCGDDLEPVERRRVEEHLAACDVCRAELSDLQTALRLVRTTPEVEPPPWLATRVMARIREQQREKRSWLQRFFFPLHVKLPFEVAALLLVCVSGYYMARTVETELQQPISREETVLAPPQTDSKQMAPIAPTPAAPAPTPLPSVNRTAEPVVPAPAQPLAPKAADQVAPAQQPEYSKAPPQPQMYGAPSRVTNEERTVPAAEPMLENTPSNQNFPGKKSAKYAKKAKKAPSSPEAGLRDSTSAETALGAASARPDLNEPVVRIRMTFANPAEASTTLREIVIRSGGSLEDEHPLQPNTLKAKLPSPRLQELLVRLERVGRISDHPQPTDTTGIIKIEIRW